MKKIFTKNKIKDYFKYGPMELDNWIECLIYFIVFDLPVLIIIYFFKIIIFV